MNHDQNFKNLILDYLRPSLDFFARPEAEFIPEKLKGSEKAELQHRLAQSRYREAAMGIIQEAREEGIQQGIQQGRQEGLREGLREGLLEAIQLTLEVRFGAAGVVLMPAIRAVQDVGVLKSIQKASSLANSPEEIRLLWEQPTSH